MGLFLGPIVFADFELPARIVFGGRQRLAVHQLADGGRVIDALGRDDAPLAWQGVFSGPDATDRALALDLLRAQGLALPLAWDAFAYVVVVADFAAVYERRNWVPYRILCTVVVDETAAPFTAGLSLVASVVGDLASASGIGGLDISAASAAVSGAGGAVAGSAGFATAATAVSALVASVEAGLAASDSDIAKATTVQAASGAAGRSAQLAAARGYARRARINLGGAGG